MAALIGCHHGDDRRARGIDGECCIRSRRYATDGDPFRLEHGERIRIANIDAPETHPGQAKCHAEIALGLAAVKRARALLDHQKVTGWTKLQSDGRAGHIRRA
jgi:endonuclease YncB( thermonuclease family)